MTRTILVVVGLIGWLVGCGSAAQTPADNNDGSGVVELLRDPWHVPHVLADSDEGAMFGLGYACAQDRALQMYYTIRIIQGRSAEMLGDRKRSNGNETTVQQDRKMRTFGWFRGAQESAAWLDKGTRLLLEAYSAGVNAAMAERRVAGLDPLFEKLGIEPEPWTPAHCIASWWAIGQYFSTDGTRELLAWRNQLEARPEQDIGRRAARIVDDDAAVVRREDVSDQWLARVKQYLRENGHRVDAGAPGAGEGAKFSHAWVVGRGKSSTGSTMLVSDPQTPVRNPSLWYEFHVRGKTFNARGIGVPGSPLLLVGFTPDVAWGATALGADQADLFRLKVDAGRPDEYQIDGKWLAMETRKEVVKVNGVADQELVIRTTRFGPIVTEFAFARPGDAPVALWRVPLCEPERETIRGAMAMMRAKDARELHAAAAGWRFPSLNLVFGDKAGVVGFTVAGAIPLRSPAVEDGAGNYAQDGSSAGMGWRGIVPHELLPHLVGPRSGWIASANHRPVGSFYPASLGLSTGSGGDTGRSWRLKELLSRDEAVTPEAMLGVHHDATNPARRDVVKLGLQLRDVSKVELSAEAGKSLEVLAAWLAAGAVSDLDAPGAALAMKMELLFRIRATELALQFGGGETGLCYFLKTVSKRLAENPKAELAAAERAFVDQALASAWRGAMRDHGDDPAKWAEAARAAQRSARIGYQDSLHGLGSLDPSRDLAVPPLRFTDVGTIACQGGQSYTQFVRLDDVDRSMSVLPAGQSEDRESPGWESTAKLWSEGKLHPAPLSEQAVRKLAVSAKNLSRSGHGATR